MDFSSREVDLGPRIGPWPRRLATVKNHSYPTPPYGNLSQLCSHGRSLGNSEAGRGGRGGKEGMTMTRHDSSFPTLSQTQLITLAGVSGGTPQE